MTKEAVLNIKIDIKLRNAIVQIAIDNGIKPTKVVRIILDDFVEKDKKLKLKVE